MTHNRQPNLHSVTELTSRTLSSGRKQQLEINTTTHTLFRKSWSKQLAEHFGVVSKRTGPIYWSVVGDITTACEHPLNTQRL